MMNSIFKQKVISNAREQREKLAERRKQQNARYKQRYDKLRVYKFPPINEINMERHFYFPKGLISRDVIKEKASYAVYPVLCSRADFVKDEWFALSLENIAKMAGVSVPSVSKAIEELITIPIDDTYILERRLETEGKRHYYMYRVRFVRRDMLGARDWRHQYMIFHTCIIDSQVWALLKPRAKALYLSMRLVSIFDIQEYAAIELEEINLSELDFEYNGPDYRNRGWDICTTPYSVLCGVVGIERSNLNSILEQLELYRLIERKEYYTKVYLKPEIE